MFFDKAHKYTQGILVSPQRNKEQVCDSLVGSDYFQMQHFITESNWNPQKIIDLAAKRTNEALPRHKLTGLIIDETGTIKQGDKSVGVGWQYFGNVGKIANSQVAVVACLNTSDFASLVDARLYLPEDWISDPMRCDEAGIPEEQQIFKTKSGSLLSIA
jgi:SRSO17 transposase